MYVYVCFVFALVRKNGIVRAPEVKPLINQSISVGLHFCGFTVDLVQKEAVLCHIL